MKVLLVCQEGIQPVKALVWQPWKKWAI